MSCRLDVQKTILRNIMDRFVKGRNTFNQLTEDSVQIVNVGTNKDSKAKKDTQAEAIAKNLAQRVAEYTNRHVMGWVNRNNKYEPYTVHFVVSPAYIESKYQALPQEQKTDPADVKISPEDMKILQDNKSKLNGFNAMLLDASPIEFLKYLAEQSYGISGSDTFNDVPTISAKEILDVAQKYFPRDSFITPDTLPPIDDPC